MKFIENIKKILETKLFIVSFFILYFLIGTLIFKDYGFSTDETLNRMSGFISLNYIVDKLNLNLELGQFAQSLPNLSAWGDKNYGVIFDLPLAFIEFTFSINDTRAAFLLKHFTNFSLFFLSCIFFYFLLNNLFKNRILSLAGLSLLVFSPRIFAESFYNPKDIVLLSMMIFALHFNIKFLINRNFKYLVLGALFGAVMTDVRVLGSYLPLLTLTIYAFDQDGKNIKKSVLTFFTYIFFYFSFTILFWPFLWENPIGNLLNAFNHMKNYPFVGDVFYFGKYINATFVPWHYFFVWFSITTPLVFLLIIIFGLIKSFKLFFENLINIEKIKNKTLWKNDYEMIQIFVLLSFLIPILLILLLSSTLYNGWRQLYFIYPSLIILGIYFLNYLYSLKKSIFFKSLISVLFIQIITTSFFIYKNHPHQNVYFNYISNKFVANNFPLDYWGLANKATIEKIVKISKKNYPLKISTASFTDLNKTKLIMNKEVKNKFIFVQDNHFEADYLFTNMYYLRNPIYNKKRYKIPDYYEPYYRFFIEGNIVNEVYINTNK